MHIWITNREELSLYILFVELPQTAPSVIFWTPLNTPCHPQACVYIEYIYRQNNTACVVNRLSICRSRLVLAWPAKSVVGKVVKSCDGSCDWNNYGFRFESRGVKWQRWALWNPQSSPSLSRVFIWSLAAAESFSTSRNYWNILAGSKSRSNSGL